MITLAKSSLLVIAIAIVLAGCGANNQPTDTLGLKEKLSGKWSAQAFSGELHEEWVLGDDKWMTQSGHYIEGVDTSFSATTKIEKVGSDLILFSVIKNSPPKIFKAIAISENKIVFENKDYKNPYQVVYRFVSETEYQRTIKGYENDSLVEYKFYFIKVDDQ